MENSGSATEKYLLLVDDDSDNRHSLERALRSLVSDMVVIGASTAEEGKAVMARYHPLVAILDLDLGTGVDEGYRLINHAASFEPAIRVITLTGNDGSEFGKRSLEAGAASFLTKPADIGVLVPLIKDACNTARLKRLQNDFEVDALSRDGLVGHSTAFKKLLRECEIAALGDHPVVLLGPTGVGKTAAAEYIHSRSSRKNGKFIHGGPANESIDLFRSEYFGHAKGSYTGAFVDRKGFLTEAHGGIIFFDEIADYSPDVQKALLKAIERKSYFPVGSNVEVTSDFRVISATNADINECIKAGKFREDLWQRLKYQVISVPSLSERREDIPEIVQFIITAIRRSGENSIRSITEEGIEYLVNHDWSRGNIRELQGALKLACCAAQLDGRSFLHASDFTSAVSATNTAVVSRLDSTEFPLDINEETEKFRIGVMKKALAQSNGNYSAAARLLSMSRDVLRRTLNKAQA